MRIFAIRPFALVGLLVAVPTSVAAHDATFALYSKYEATTAGNEIAFVYALEKNATLRLLEEQLVNASVDADELSGHLDSFSQYFFERIQVSNNGKPCTHPPKLEHFSWDESTSRVLAVTKFSCASELDELVIRSVVTHDMPNPHATMGDLAHGLALVRHAFANDDIEAKVTLHLLPQDRRTRPKPKRRRGRFSYVAVPDTTRRYDAWAQKVLGQKIEKQEEPEPEPEQSLGATLLNFVGEGIKHIFLGLDHILFILTLILTVRTWRQLAIIVTSFTVAHSLTLIGATLGLVNLAAPVIEPAIAASVLFVAVDALVRPKATARPALTFGFGLLHGFGLSEVLRDLGLRGGEMASALLGFNVGVELGQLAIVGPLFPLVLLLQRRERAYTKTRQALCLAVSLLALFWLYTRIADSL